jgi:hypothetical protein
VNHDDFQEVCKLTDEQMKLVAPYLSMHPKYPEILVVTHCRALFHEALDFKAHSPSESQIAGAINQMDLLAPEGVQDDHEEVEVEEGQSHSKL